MARFWVRLTPRAGEDRVDGASEDGVLHVRVKAAPVDGAANAALLRLLAQALQVPRTSVAIERGTTGRRKRVAAATIDAAQLTARWPGIRTE